MEMIKGNQWAEWVVAMGRRTWFGDKWPFLMTMRLLREGFFVVDIANIIRRIEARVVPYTLTLRMPNGIFRIAISRDHSPHRMCSMWFMGKYGCANVVRRYPQCSWTWRPYHLFLFTVWLGHPMRRKRKTFVGYSHRWQWLETVMLTVTCSSMAKRYLDFCADGSVLSTIWKTNLLSPKTKIEGQWVGWKKTLYIFSLKKKNVKLLISTRTSANEIILVSAAQWKLMVPALLTKKNKVTLLTIFSPAVQYSQWLLPTETNIILSEVPILLEHLKQQPFLVPLSKIQMTAYCFPTETNIIRKWSTYSSWTSATVGRMNVQNSTLNDVSNSMWTKKTHKNIFGEVLLEWEPEIHTCWFTFELLIISTVRNTFELNKSKGMMKYLHGWRNGTLIIDRGAF